MDSHIVSSPILFAEVQHAGEPQAMGTILSSHQLYLLLILGMWVKRKMFLKSLSCPTFKSSSCPTEVYHHKPEAFVKFILGGLSSQGGRILESNEGASLIGIQESPQCCTYLHPWRWCNICQDNESKKWVYRGTLLDINVVFTCYLIIQLPHHVLGQIHHQNCILWEYLACNVEALNSLSSGLWPSQDWQGHQWPAQSRDAQRVGTQLAGGRAATLWNTREDLEFLALHLVSDTTAPINLAHYVRLQGMRSVCPLYFGQSKPQGQKDK